MFSGTSCASTIALGVGLFASAMGLSTLVACEEDPHRRSDGTQQLLETGCTAAPGEIPKPGCDDSDKSCEEEPGCSIDETKCGSASTCLPMGDNRGKSVSDLRLRSLHIVAPKALAAQFVRRTVVTANVDLDAPSCGERGKGQFSWLMRIDRDKNEIITGGAPPASDPFGTGYCFARFKSVEGIDIAPLRAPIAFTGRTFKSTVPQALNVPIFLTPDGKSTIVLPLSEVVIDGVSLSEDGNCIGALNKKALKGDCRDEPGTCTKWTTAGSLGGFITLEEADKVFIPELNQSLCVVITQSSRGPDNRCKREGGKIPLQGDYCSIDKKPGSCKDSMWMAATFAAAAVKIDPAAAAPGCSGTAP